MFKEIVDFIRELYKQPEGFIPLHAPVFNGNEKKYLNEYIDTTYLSSVGKFVDEFEEKMAADGLSNAIWLEEHLVNLPSSYLINK